MNNCRQGMLGHMGRQILIGADHEDERCFLSFLRTTADVRIFESFADSPQALWVDELSARLEWHWTYGIWNLAFPWEPEVARNTKQPYIYYVSNSETAPVIELNRSDLVKRQFGRLYWAKDFAAPNGLPYDVGAFERWYEQLIRWVRRNTRPIPGRGLKTHCFPGAARFLGDDAFRPVPQDSPETKVPKERDRFVQEARGHFKAGRYAVAAGIFGSLGANLDPVSSKMFRLALRHLDE